MADHEIVIALAKLETRLEALQKEMEQIQADLRQIKAQQDRWKGALPVIVSIGAIVGFFVTSLDHIKAMFK